MSITIFSTLIAALLALSPHARAETPGEDLSSSDRAALKAVVRQCDAADDSFLDDRVDDELSIFLISQSMVADGDVIYVYAPKTRDIIVAAARRIRQLGLVVTDEQFMNADLRDKVMTVAQFKALGGNNADCSEERALGRCGAVETKIARVLFGVSLRECGNEFRYQTNRKNVLRPMYSRMIGQLWSRYEEYDPVAKVWRPSLINRSSRDTSR